MVTSADIFVNIVSGDNYPPDKDLSVIYQLHCTKTNECPVKIWNFQSNNHIEFPPGSFVQGAVYPIVAYRLEFDSELASFIGYRASSVNIPNYIPRNWYKAQHRK